MWLCFTFSIILTYSMNFLLLVSYSPSSPSPTPTSLPGHRCGDVSTPGQCEEDQLGEAWCRQSREHNLGTGMRREFILPLIFKHLFLIELWFNLEKIINPSYFISLTLYTLQNLAPTKFNDFTVHGYIELHMILISEEHWYQIKGHKPSTALTFNFRFSAWKWWLGWCN